MIRRVRLPRGLAPAWLDGPALAWLADVGLPHAVECGGDEFYGRLSFASLERGLEPIDDDLHVLGAQTFLGDRTFGLDPRPTWCLSRATGQVLVRDADPDAKWPLRVANTSVAQLGACLDALVEWGAGPRPRSLARLRAAWLLADRAALGPGAEWSLLLEWLPRIRDRDLVCRADVIG